MRRVLFISGAWRSGSTLLGDLLGSVPGLCHVGELHHAWGRGMEKNWLCGCGEPFRSCSFWHQVMRESGGGGDAPEFAELERLRLTIAREFRKEASPALIHEAYPGYVDAVGGLAEAVFRVSGAGVVVDSSKSARHGCALLAGGRIELTVLHLVRDPRATVFSLVERAKLRLDDPQGSAMLTPDLDSAIKLWIWSNYEAERLGRLAHRYILLRYEDLAGEPFGFVERILETAGELNGDNAKAAFLKDSPLVQPSHTISGNPDRLRKGARTEIRVDDEWQSRLDRSAMELAEERTRDWMAKYGYAT